VLVGGCDSSQDASKVLEVDSAIERSVFSSGKSFFGDLPALEIFCNGVAQ
jgi:hypothetical protein